jgi:peptidoglycan/xylan/chitin deacetylase (PgdA/CDA1 family)
MNERARTPWYRSWPVDFAMRLVYWCGLFHLVGLFRKHLGRRRLLILLYHRIAPPGGDTAIAGLELDAFVRADQFDGHMKLLRWFGEPLPLDAAFERLRGSSVGPQALIAVTFDDGYRDNFTLGRPIWKRHGVPVTLFPAVSPVDRAEWLWWDELEWIIGHAHLEPGRLRPLAEALEDIAPGPGWPEVTKVAHDRDRLARLLLERMVDLPMELRGLVLTELAERLGVARPGRRHDTHAIEPDRLYLNWDELRAMTREGVRIGGHTMRHPRLPSEPASVAVEEITACRTALEQKLQEPITCFAMPGGFYGSREVQILARAGYHLAVTVEKGVNYPDTDPFRLRRISLSWDQPHHLALKLALGDWLFASHHED